MKDINFLVTEPLTNQDETLTQKKSVPAAKIVLVVLCITIGIAILFLPGIFVKSLEAQIADVEQSMQDAKYRQLAQAKAQYNQVTQDVDGKKAIVKDIDNKSVPSSQIILMVEQALPEGCYLDALGFEGNSLNISGKAVSSLVFAEFMGSLDRLDLLTGSTDSISMEESGTAVTFNLKYAVSVNGGK